MAVKICVFQFLTKYRILHKKIDGYVVKPVCMNKCRNIS